MEKTVLKEIIEESGLKKWWIAEQIGMSPSLFSHALSGRCDFTEHQIKKIAKILRRKPEELAA